MTRFPEGVLRTLIVLLGLGLMLAGTAPLTAQDAPTPRDTTRVLPPDHPLRPETPPGVPEKGSRNPIGALLTAPFRLIDRMFYSYAEGLQNACGSFSGGITGEEGLAACGPKHVSWTFGSLGSKSGFWGGGVGIHSDLWSPTGFKTGVTAAATWRAYQEYTAYVGWNDPKKRPYLRLTGFYDRDTRDQFWGIGPDTPEGAETDYSQEQFGAVAMAGIPESKVIWGDVGVRYEKSFVFTGWNRETPNTVDVFEDVAGVSPQAELWGPFANVVLNLTDAPGHPTVGVKVKGRGALYRSVDEDQDFNWVTYGGEVQGHLPLGSEWHILSALVGFDTAEPEEDGDEILFNYLPYLGGSRRLRGHQTWRFVDRTAAYGTVEYRYRIWQENARDLDNAGAIETAIFYDLGSVGEKLDDIDLTDEHSYGLEFRVYIADKHLVRLGAARSDEGTRLNFSLSDNY